MRVEASTTIDRPIEDVWDFYVVNHVRNHPRWDPTIKLEKTSDGPLEVGSIVTRRVTRFGRVTEGTMEVIELAPRRVMRVAIKDGPNAVEGFATFRSTERGSTEITIGGEFPGIDESMGEQLRAMIGGSAANIKALIESET